MLLEKCKDHIVSYHEHASLLDHKQEEELTEAERIDAWAEYQAEVMSRTPSQQQQQQLTTVTHFPFSYQCVFVLVSHSQRPSENQSGHLEHEVQ